MIICNDFQGYTGDNGNCICSSGYFGVVTYIQAVPTGCDACGKGYYCKSSTNKTPCAAGKYSESLLATSASTCFNCPIGLFSNTTAAANITSCIPCKKNGFMPNDLQSDCNPIPCPSSYMYTATPGNCVCAAGFYGTISYSNTGQLSGCNVCIPGFYCPGNGIKVPCFPGSFCLQGSVSPTLCNNGTFSTAPLAITPSVCSDCQKNYWSFAAATKVIFSF